MFYSNCFAVNFDVQLALSIKLATILDLCSTLTESISETSIFFQTKK